MMCTSRFSLSIRAAARLFRDGLGGHQSFQRHNELVDALRALVAVLPVAHAHLALLHLAVAKHQHEGDLLELRLADLEVHLFAAPVQLDPEAFGFEPRYDGLRVFEMTVCDGQHNGLVDRRARPAHQSLRGYLLPDRLRGPDRGRRAGRARHLLLCAVATQALQHIADQRAARPAPASQPGELDPLTPPAGLERIDRELRPVYAALGASEAWQLRRYASGHQETPAMRAAVLAFLEKWL